jgi:hypothetical protein
MPAVCPSEGLLTSVEERFSTHQQQCSECGAHEKGTTGSGQIDVRCDAVVEETVRRSTHSVAEVGVAGERTPGRLAGGV